VGTLPLTGHILPIMVTRHPVSSAGSSWSTGDGRNRGHLSATSVARQSFLWASHLGAVQRLVSTSAVTRPLVHRFVAGETVDDVIAAARRLAAQGITSTVDYLGEDVADLAAARRVAGVYRSLIRRLAADGLASSAEVSIKLSALGQELDEEEAMANAHAVCKAATEAGTTVTVDMENHTTTDSTLEIGRRLRAEFPSTGLVIQAALRRSEQDCRGLARPGSRVRLCKGAYQEPAALAWQRREEVRAAYVRCLRNLVEGGAYPMVATHDPALIEVSRRLLERRFAPGLAHEHQMLYGVRPEEQRRLVRAGERVRVYIPFGDQWYPYLMRRMAERPANLALVLRALRSRR